VIQLAAFEAQRETQVIAIFKTQAQHFTGTEKHFLEGGLDEFGVAEIAFLEFAVDEPALRKVGIGEVASLEGTCFIIALLQGLLREIFPLELFFLSCSTLISDHSFTRLVFYNTRPWKQG